MELQKTKKKDFIEIEFLGRNISNNEIFDTNNLEEARKINPEIKEVKPFVVCIGEGMVVKGLDEALEGKEIGKKYTLTLPPEKAFGPRDSRMVKLVPMKFFLSQKIYPQKGMTLAIDNMLVKVANVSAGRVLIDFNNQLAGKDIGYEFTVKKIVSDAKEKVSALQKFFFSGQEFPCDVDEAKKKIIFHDLNLTPVLKAVREKFLHLVGFDVEILEKSDKKEKQEKEEKADKKQ